MAEIWYVDFTHKYKIIPGVMVGGSPSLGQSPSLGRSPSNCNFFYRTTFRELLGMVGGRETYIKFYGEVKQ